MIARGPGYTLAASRPYAPSSDANERGRPTTASFIKTRGFPLLRLGPLLLPPWMNKFGQSFTFFLRIVTGFFHFLFMRIHLLLLDARVNSSAYEVMEGYDKRAGRLILRVIFRAFFARHLARGQSLNHWIFLFCFHMLWSTVPVTCQMLSHPLLNKFKRISELLPTI